MSLTVSRRSVLAGAAALPFLRMPGARAATPGMLTFGLSSYPPNILPWANTGTAAAHREADDLSRPYRLMRPTAACAASSPRAGRPKARTAWVFKLRDATFQNGEKVTSADVKWTHRAGRGREVHRLSCARRCRPSSKIETPDARPCAS